MRANFISSYKISPSRNRRRTHTLFRFLSSFSIENRRQTKAKSASHSLGDLSLFLDTRLLCLSLFLSPALSVFFHRCFTVSPHLGRGPSTVYDPRPLPPSCLLLGSPTYTFSLRHRSPSPLLI